MNGLTEKELGLMLIARMKDSGVLEKEAHIDVPYWLHGLQKQVPVRTKPGQPCLERITAALVCNLTVKVVDGEDVWDFTHDYQGSYWLFDVEVTSSNTLSGRLDLVECVSLMAQHPEIQSLYCGHPLKKSHRILVKRESSSIVCTAEEGFTGGIQRAFAARKLLDGSMALEVTGEKLETDDAESTGDSAQDDAT